MKIIDGQSSIERGTKDRMINSSLKDGLKKVGLIVTIALVTILLNLVYTKVVNAKVGNPYECASCKSLGHACSEHRNYSREQDITEKIKLIVNYYYVWKEAETDTFIQMYYNSYNYNMKCDFCTEDLEECDGCRTTRLDILERYQKLFKENTKLFSQESIDAGYCVNDIDKQKMITLLKDEYLK